MAIETTTSGAIIVTGEAIALYQLVTVRAALKLEARGLRFKGGMLRTGWAKRLGLKPRASYETVIAELDKRIAEATV